jgi:photosystem II stability/assembly factor-like uncharacterized protein
MPDLNGFRWAPTNAPLASSRTDDIWFFDATTGWAVNSDGDVLETVDAGQHWTRTFHAEGVYLRALAFTDRQHGFIGTLSGAARLFRTTDGGGVWERVENLPDGAPVAICGLTAPDSSTVFGAGTNFPNRRPAVIRSADRGQTWSAVDLSAQATLLVDIYFKNPLEGWVVGGKADVPSASRSVVKPVVLATTDGGQTWEDRLEGLTGDWPLGEWGWKIFFVTEQVGYVSLESFELGAILRTADGGLTWERLSVNDPQRNANLEGIGFVTEQIGWVGGWGDANFQGGFSSATHDGGQTWQNANEIGRFLNRFRFIREPELVGYASGDTVYKFSAAADPEALGAAAPVREAGRIGLLQPDALDDRRLTYKLARDARYVRVDVWDRFGEHLTTIEERNVPAGEATIRLPETKAGSDSARGGYMLVRMDVGGQAESRAVFQRGAQS